MRRIVCRLGTQSLHALVPAKTFGTKLPHLTGMVSEWKHLPHPSLLSSLLFICFPDAFHGWDDCRHFMHSLENAIFCAALLFGVARWGVGMASMSVRTPFLMLGFGNLSLVRERPKPSVSITFS